MPIEATQCEAVVLNLFFEHDTKQIVHEFKNQFDIFQEVAESGLFISHPKLQKVFLEDIELTVQDARTNIPYHNFEKKN
jgi:hypothetical protein